MSIFTNTILFFRRRLAAFLYEAKDLKNLNLSPGLMPLTLINQSPIPMKKPASFLVKRTQIRNAIIARFKANPIGKT